MIKAINQQKREYNFSINEEELVYTYGTDSQISNYCHSKGLSSATRENILNKAKNYLDIEYNEDTKEYDVYIVYNSSVVEDNLYRSKYGKHYFNFCVDFTNRNDRGVYYIYNNNSIYIGSTTRSFYTKFLEHYSSSQTKKMLEDRGTFSVLWVAPKDATTEDIRKKKQEYIDKYKNEKKYKVVNTRTYNTASTKSK